MKKITFIFILICSYSNGQDFQELYVEKLKGTWEIYQTESFTESIDPKMDSLYFQTKGKSYKETLIENQKNTVKEHAEKLSEIIDCFSLKLSELDSLTIIEEKSLNTSLPMDFSKKGAILAKDSIYGFTYSSEKESGGLERIDYELVLS